MKKKPVHDASFQKIEESDETRLGPAALLVSGFTPEITEKLTTLLQESGMNDHQIVFCTEKMVKQPLGQALEGGDDEPAAPDKLPRVMVLSGMTGGEIQTLLTRYPQSGLPRPIFAAVTEANLEFPVGKLIMELLKEQRQMSGGR